MTRTVPPLALALALVSLGSLQAAGVRFRPGLWEVTTTSEGAHARSATARRCYTPEQVRVANGSAAEVVAATRANEATLSLERKGCKVQEVRLVGDQITEIVECPAFLLEDVTTYRAGDRFESDTTMTPKQGPPRRTHRAARRVGDCK
jgi:hypothetical protein